MHMGDAASAAPTLAPRKTVWHSGLDVGLLSVRLGLAVIFLGKGTEKMFGWFGGPGISGFANQLAGAGGKGFGYTGDTTALAWLAAVTEVGGGLSLLFGVLAPLGAAALLGMAINLFALRWGAPVLPNPGQNVAVDVLQTSMILGVMFAGPGRISVDFALGIDRKWRDRPIPIGLSGLVLAVIVSAAVLMLFR